MTKEQRSLLADGLKDFANLAAGALIFGQSLTNQPVSASMIASGGMLWVAAMIAALVVLGRRKG